MDEQEIEVFDSLPPALRRKLFSNLERFRLEQMRLAQANTLNRRRSDQSLRCPPFASTSTADLCRQSRGSPNTTLKRRAARHPNKQAICGSVPLSSRGRCKSAHRVLQKPSSRLQTAYLTAQADSEWFQSLPPKVQQQHFTVEEQARLGGWRSSAIFDAADQALYKLGSTGESSVSLPVTSTLSRSSSISSMSSSARFADSGVDVDGSIYDSFRWLDEEDDIDLSLDYHAHLAEAAAVSKKNKPSHRRRPSSFRRTFSISSASASLSHGGGSALPSPRLRSLTASQSHFQFSNTQTPRSRSVSKSVPVPPIPANHLPPSRHESVDHPAQFYQDPEARLKLRVYLASPQKFDEAIEFGFPSLEHNDNLGTPFCYDRKWKMQESPTSNSFFESDPVSPYDSLSGPPSPQATPRPATSAVNLIDSTWHKSSTCDLQNSRPSFTDRRPRAIQPMVLNSSNLGGREMTLKMTLTRPDLRSSDLLSSPKSSTAEEDPLKLADLPVFDEKAPIWDKPEKCSMRNVWRKITRR